MWLIFSLYVPKFFINKTHLHLPLTSTKKVLFDEEKVLIDANQKDALIFTSKEGVKYFSSVLEKLSSGKYVFCSGQKTLEQVEKYYKGRLFAASPESQEGIIDLIKTHKPLSIFYPHAEKIRDLLSLFLKESNCDYQELVCYQTQAVENVVLPNQDINGYFFGAPSQVEIFIKNQTFDPLVDIYVQGEVTKEAVKRLLNKDAKILPLF